MFMVAKTLAQQRPNASVFAGEYLRQTKRKKLPMGNDSAEKWNLENLRDEKETAGNS